MPWGTQRKIQQHAKDIVEDASSAKECVLVLTESHYGSGKALLVSQILNADEQTIERIVSEMEKK